MIRWISVLALLPVPAFGDQPVIANGDAVREINDAPVVGPFGKGPGDVRDRLHRVFFVRLDEKQKPHGHDAVDPLLWRDSRYLLEGNRHNTACETLDEFLAQRPTSGRRDLLKDAVLQNDLWSIFDWTLLGESADDSSKDMLARRRLRARLATAIRRLALSRPDIEALPDTYRDAVGSRQFADTYLPDHREKSFLPKEMFDPQGPWVCLYDTPLAPSHASHFSRSTFLVFIRFPDGRAAALKYFRRLNLFPNPILPNEQPFGRIGTGANQRRVRGALWRVNPDLPQIPAGTQVALVRRMMLIDTDGELVASKICQMVQLRVYRDVAKGIDIPGPKRAGSQDFFEYKMSRAALFAGEAGGLKPVDLQQPTYTTFMSHGEVEFRHPPSPPNCSTCHQKSGIHSIQSYAKFGFTQAAMHGSQLKQIAAGRERDVYWALRRKKERADWGMLRGYWETNRFSEQSAPER